MRQTLHRRDPEPIDQAAPRDGRGSPVAPQPKSPRHWVRRGAAVTLLGLTGLGAMAAVPNSTLPPPLSTAAHFVTETLSGETALPAPALPALPQLNPQLLAHGEALGHGQSVSQPVIQDPNGGYHEPVTVIVENCTVSQLKAMLETQGWSDPGIIPMSTMLVTGHTSVLNMVKNSELGGLSRDHLRVFNLGQGRLGIAASRDLDPEIELSPTGGLSFHHAVDKNLDAETNLVVQDLTKAHPQFDKTLEIVQGVRTHNQSSYPTDGQMFILSQ